MRWDRRNCDEVLTKLFKVTCGDLQSHAKSTKYYPLTIMSQADLQNLVDFLKPYGYSFLSKLYSQGWILGQEYIFPTFRSLLSSHPDIISLFLLLVTLYMSLMVLNTVSRLMYSFVMGILRMSVMVALVLGAVWIVKAGRGEDATEMFAGGVQWVLGKGKQYVWNATGNFLNR
jgi:Nuclear pore assembly and biogenesis